MIFKDKIIAKRKTELRKLLNLKILERILETLFHITPFIVSKSILQTHVLNNIRFLILLLLDSLEISLQDFIKLMKKTKFEIDSDCKQNIFLSFLFCFLMNFYFHDLQVIFATFLTYILINDRPLDAKTVFVSLSFFNILKFSIEMLSRSVQENMKFYVAIKRVQKFLNSDDLIECNMKRMDQRGKTFKSRCFFKQVSHMLPDCRSTVDLFLFSIYQW